LKGGKMTEYGLPGEKGYEQAREAMLMQDRQERQYYPYEGGLTRMCEQEEPDSP
jgi:hypothetical protein